MTLHRLTSVTMGVPNVAETQDYYTQFGLQPDDGGWFSTQDGGRELRVVPAPTRRLVELHIAVDDPDDLARVAGNLARLGVDAQRQAASLSAVEKATGVRATLEDRPAADPAWDPGDRLQRPRPHRKTRPTGARHPAGRASLPRKLGHAVVGTTDLTATTSFFTDGLGFKVSDRYRRGRRVPALLHRPPQPARPGRAGQLPAPHVLAGR